MDEIKNDNNKTNFDEFKSSGQSPWGTPPGSGNGRGPIPPNIDEVIKKIQEFINKYLPGGKSGGLPIILVVSILIVIWGLSGLYRVLPDEQGVVLRFGKFTSTTQPGLNYHIPYPVERVLTPKVTKVNRMDIGFKMQVNFYLKYKILQQLLKPHQKQQ